MVSTRFPLEVRPKIPEPLARLSDLASDLLYSWDRDVRRLFRLLDNQLYETCRGNLKLFLRRIAQPRLEAAVLERPYMDAYRRVVGSYDAYLATKPADEIAPFGKQGNCIAYFCFEFGLHESLPLYSGGLGILAGDYCKAASDLALPVFAVGLMYRMGYFRQQIDAQGNQIALDAETDFDQLPAIALLQDDSTELRVNVPIGKMACDLRVWRVRAGHTTLLLLDADVDGNEPELRSITHQLYGGDAEMRIRQEIVLGIGGVRALRALDIEPGVWHLNEGHAALGVVERCSEYLARGWSLEVALEAVAASTVFTTHTPVMAGHDVFDTELVRANLGDYLTARKIEAEWLIGLGGNRSDVRLNMTTLAMRGSRRCNGVSRVHGRVAAEMEQHIWPDISPEDNPMTFVTNGVHLPTFMALDWQHLLDTRFSEWRANLSNAAFWSCIDTIPDHRFWSLRLDLKAQLLAEVSRRIHRQHLRNGTAAATTQRVTARLRDTDEVLVLGFARRFATYKRAMLLFHDRSRMARLLGNPEQPVVVIMAGKAHPHDEPGRELIREIYSLSMEKEFVGGLILVEDYELALARTLVAGVDVWINTPESPLEACGTSGIKAAMNGVINLSVLDGWWAEAFDGTNGWAIAPHGGSVPADYRDREEAKDLLDMLEREVVPSYFARHRSDTWVQMAKASMRTVIPQFNSERMLLEYVQRLYVPAHEQFRRLVEENGAQANLLAGWKCRIADSWEGVSMRVVGEMPKVLADGEPLELTLEVSLNGLTPGDIRIECLVAADNSLEAEEQTFEFKAVVSRDAASQQFTLRLQPPYAGLQHCRIRMYPYHELLAHPFEMGRMLWLRVPSS